VWRVTYQETVSVARFEFGEAERRFARIQILVARMEAEGFDSKLADELATNMLSAFGHVIKARRLVDQCHKRMQ
jgi:hypothetical protein